MVYCTLYFDLCLYLVDTLYYDTRFKLRVLYILHDTRWERGEASMSRQRENRSKRNICFVACQSQVCHMSGPCRRFRRLLGNSFTSNARSLVIPSNRSFGRKVSINMSSYFPHIQSFIWKMHPYIRYTSSNRSGVSKFSTDWLEFIWNSNCDYEANWSITLLPDGVRLPTNMRQRVANGSLFIDTVQRAADQGTYTCTARNKHNFTSQRSVEVRVLGEWTESKYFPIPVSFAGITRQDDLICLNIWTLLVTCGTPIHFHSYVYASCLRSFDGVHVDVVVETFNVNIFILSFMCIFSYILLLFYFLL